MPPSNQQEVPITLDLTVDSRSISVGATIEVPVSVAVDIVLRVQIPEFARLESLVVAAPVYLVKTPRIGYDVEKLVDADRLANAVFASTDLASGLHTFGRQWTPLAVPGSDAELEIDWHARVITRTQRTVAAFGSGLRQPEYLSGWTRSMLVRFAEPRTFVVPHRTDGVRSRYPPLDRETVMRQPGVLDRWETDVARAYEAIVNPAATFSDPASERLPVMSREEFERLLMDDVEWLEGYRREQANARRLHGTKPRGREFISRDPDG
jgi:hypothetical protein